MPSQQISAESEKHFKANWTDTPLEYITLTPDLDTSTLDEYISIKFFSLPVDKLVGFDGSSGRKAVHGYLRVMCYQKKEILALGLADSVSDFFDDTLLPLDIHVGIGQAEPVIDLGNGWQEVQLRFAIVQYS